MLVARAAIAVAEPWHAPAISRTAHDNAMKGSSIIMSHRQIDGTLIVAQLKRRFAGGGLYKDVTVRTPDGRDEKLGTLMVLKDVQHGLVPGCRGRFYSYNV